MGPAALAQVLRPLQEIFDERDFPDLLVHLDRASDAALYRISDDRVMIQSVDFFPPMVEDPYWYGAIAAANAMSDVYAMGGEVALALNIAEFPEDLPTDYLSEILRGGGDKVREAGAVIAGGHTITDRVPKYGLCVTGFVERDLILTKAGAQPGDRLLLTKPLGVGVILTTEKRRIADPDHVAAAIEQMATLNRVASQALRQHRHSVRAATDVTGFSLLGHACEMAEQSGVCLQFEYAKLPFLPGAQAYANEGIHCSATPRNQAFFGPHVKLGPDIEPHLSQLLFGSESSGGLLIAVAEDRAAQVIQTMQTQGQACWEIGSVSEGSGVRVD